MLIPWLSILDQARREVGDFGLVGLYPILSARFNGLAEKAQGGLQFLGARGDSPIPFVHVCSLVPLSVDSQHWYCPPKAAIIDHILDLARPHQVGVDCLALVHGPGISLRLLLDVRLPSKEASSF